MTAEIAILNRIGVALAADSAVTIRTSGSRESKVYNSVDKLFCLSNNEPVGVMMNGTAEVMGVPIETLVKGFRDSAYARPQRTVAEYARRFFEYMRDELPGEPSTSYEHAAAILIRRLLYTYQSGVEEYGAKSPRPRLSVETFLKRRFAAEFKQGLAQLRRTKRAPGVGSENLPPGLGELSRRAIRQTLGDDFLVFADEAEELISLLLLADLPTGSATRFVFSGFGTGQIFPAVYAADWDLPLLGAHKVRPISDEAISSKQSALILPFAQKEMVERFMDGVDDAYQEFLEATMESAMTRFAGFALETAQAKPTTAQRGEIRRMLSRYMDELKTVTLDFRKGTFRHSVLEVVQFMPKSDLAEMAESLVNLTSIKRRVSAERETVGGPIDVAVISKNDGFVWIKRKRYFEREINERFFMKQRLRLNRWVEDYGEEEGGGSQ